MGGFLPVTIEEVLRGHFCNDGVDFSLGVHSGSQTLVGYCNTPGKLSGVDAGTDLGRGSG